MVRLFRSMMKRVEIKLKEAAKDNSFEISDENAAIYMSFVAKSLRKNVLQA